MHLRQFVCATFLCFICSSSTWAAPAAPIEITVTQPDGTTLTVIPKGDEYANWTETKQGHTVVKLNSTWFYAEKDSSGALRATNIRAGSLNAIQLQALPVHLSPEPDPQALAPATVRKIQRTDANGQRAPLAAGSISHTQKVLTILADYTNRGFTYSDASFESLIYGTNNSVKDFFLENSYGGFTIEPPTESQGTANDGIIRVTRPVNHPNQGGTSAISRLEARLIVALADGFINFSDYDSDGNGTVSEDELSIVIIVAGYENSYGGASSRTPNVWGHRWNFSSTLTLDGVGLSPYTMFGEMHGTSAANEHQATIGIMCHELGHLMLGLPDLYDINGGSAGIGDWGLMGGGSWNDTGGWQGTSPSHLGGWSKVATDFSVPTDVDGDQSGLSFTKADSNEDVKRVWIDKYKSELSYEYFLVENRQLSGYDAGLPGSGLMIWHVDESKTSNADENHKWVDIEEADGLAELDADFSSDSGDLFPGSTDNRTFNNASNPDSKGYSSAVNGIGVTGISNSAATMTANIAALVGGVGDHVRYDENSPTNIAGYGVTTAWVGLRVLNDTNQITLDGVDVYVNDSNGATIDIYYYSSMSGGTPSGLIYSETAIAAGPGWNRLILATQQPFPSGAERGIVLKVVNDSSNHPIVFDAAGVASGRSYYSSNGAGTFLTMCPSICGDINVTALLSDDDVTPPSVTTITPSTTGPTNADSVSFDITFSEDIVNFNNSADLTVTHNGTSNSGVTITGSGDSYTANVTGISGNGSFTLAVNTGSDVEDTAGLALGASVTSAPVSIDNSAPTVSIGAASAASTSSGPVSYTVSYQGANTITLAAGDITLNKTGSANGSVAVTGSGTSTRTVTINNITGDGTLGISIAAGTATDNASNSATSAGSSATVVVDNTAPTILIGTASAASTSGGPVSYVVTYTSADFITLAAGDITLNKTGDADGSVAVTGAGATTRTVTISNITGDGTLGVSIAAGTATDDVSNSAPAAGPSASFEVDNTAPAVAIGAASIASTSAGPVTYTVTYTDADAVTLAAGDITLNKTGDADGSVAVTGAGATTRTVTISNITGDGTLGISLAAGTATDDAGNSADAAGPSATFDVDNTAPIVTIGGASASSTSTGPVTYTVTYTDADAVTLAAGDITLNKTGDADGSVAVTGAGATTRTVTISNITGDGTLGISLAAGTATDDAGNSADAAGPSATFDVDNTAPIVTIGGSSAASTSAGPVSYTITYTDADAVTLAAGDITLNKTGDADGSVAVTGAGATTRTVTISNITGDGTLGISLAAGTATDDAGNSADAAGPSATFDVDNTAPTVTIGGASASSTSTGPVTYTVTYTDADAVTLAAGDITLNKTGDADGSVAVTGAGATTRTVTISNITGDGTLGISLAAGTATDDAGNSADAAGPSATFDVDNTAPTVTIGGASATSTRAGPVSFTVTYTEAHAISLAAIHITLNKTGNADGSITVTGTGSSTRTITISDITGTGSLSITIDAGTATDEAGNETEVVITSDTINVFLTEEIFEDSFEFNDI